jgi:replicative DNA helicase
MLHPDDASRLAEQATLGALILEPQHLSQVRAWLRPADFADALHGQVYSVLCERHAAGDAIDPATVAEALVGRAPSMSPAIRVHDLIRAVPPVAHAQTYARIVAEAGLRREVAGLGVLLRAGALQSALARESVPMTATCSLVDAALVSITRRWDAATGTPRALQETTPIQLHAALRNPDLRLGADKLLRTHPGRDVSAEHAHEALLVGSLITHPRDVYFIGACLSPQRISSPPWRTVYGATLELCELQEPVDLVTVATTTARLSHHGQPAPSMAQLLQVVGAARHTDPRQAEQVVWIDQIRRIADNGADQLLKGAANPGLQLGDLIDTGHKVTTALRDSARMLPEHLANPYTRLHAVERAAQETRQGPVAG